jgi:hypothetical protein
MNITMTMMKENEDGSADMALEVDDEARKVLINAGLISMLTQFVVENKDLLPPTEEEEESTQLDWIEEIEEDEEDEEDIEEDNNVYVAINEDQKDEVVLQELKRVYSHTYEHGCMHAEDIKFYTDTRAAVEVMLHYYMTTQDADEYIAEIDSYYSEE